jgi:hypothetical protein
MTARENDMREKHDNFRGGTIVKLILVSVLEGEGTVENVSRIVHYYLDFDGNLIFKKTRGGKIYGR